MKILMVCLGNICRSPLAQGILEAKIKERNLNWQVDSAGTGAWHIGEQPDHRSIAVALQNNLDIKHQKARKFVREDLDKFDVIFAMDSENYQNIVKLATDQQSVDKVHLIMNEHNPGRNQSVPDPYWNDNGFEKVFKMLSEACESFIQKTISQ